MLTTLSRHLFHPLWDVKERSVRLKTLRRLEATQWLSREDLAERQWARLLATVRHAYEQVPYYRRAFDRAGTRPSDIQAPRDLPRLPLLTKTAIQREGASLVASPHRREQLRTASTGGSTGTALRLYFDRPCEEMRNAAAIRADRWAGWNLGEPRAAVWGNPPRVTSWRGRLRLALRDRLTYLDTMRIDDESVARFVDAWRRRRPSLLFGHAHSIFIVARYLERERIADLRPKGIVSTSMMLLQGEREVIERVFACKVTNRYGCEEVGLVACECERHDGLHVNVDHVYVELVDEEGRPVRPGEQGRVVVTDLLNRGMPLVRYVVEDMAVQSDRRCPCGRGQPLIESIVGRVADFLRRPDGSLVAGVSLVERTLTAIPGLEQMQIVQDGLQDFVVHAVPGEGFGPRAEAALGDELRRVFGPGARVAVRVVDRLAQTASGKYRFAICNVPEPGLPQAAGREARP